MFVDFAPRLGRSGGFASTGIKGSGWICAPAGHAYAITITGGTDASVWKDMDGRSSFSIVGSRYVAPELKFSGRWQGPALVMNDRGTLAAAFLADGTLAPHPSVRGQAMPITFNERAWWWTDPCR